MALAEAVDFLMLHVKSLLPPDNLQARFAALNLDIEPMPAAILDRLARRVNQPVAADVLVTVSGCTDATVVPVHICNLRPWLAANFPELSIPTARRGTYTLVAPRGWRAPW